MNRLAAPSLVALAMAALLGSLSLVTWRQARAMEALAALDRVRQERELVEAEKQELVRRIQFLESRGHIVSRARELLGMHTPATDEIVYLSGVGR